mgnify:CR=1 FL=1
MSIMPAPTVLRDRGAEGERGDEVEERRPDDRLARREHARRHHGRDRVRGIVEAVDVIEEQRDQNEADDDENIARSRITVGCSATSRA